MISYKDIIFGTSSGEKEGLEYPDLARDGFYEIGSILHSTKSTSKFLILGNKGTGKSLLAEKLRLDSESNSQDDFVIVKHLQDFPYKPFSKIYPGEGEKQSKYPSSWSWIILLIIIDALRNIEGIAPFSDVFTKNTRELEVMGFLPTDELQNLVIVSSKKTARINLEFISKTETSNYMKKNSNEVNFINTIETLKKMIREVECDKNILIVFDGLDDILTKTEVQYEALSALIFEIERLNLFFQRNSKKIKIIVLCRTDLFEKLPNPNKNKIRQDSCVDINWYEGFQNAEKSNLVLLVNKRASLQHNSVIDVFETWFPKKVNDKPTIDLLLDNTRYTPRDFIQLLNYLKKFYSGNVFTAEQIMQALKDYSINYFLPEIKDEITGYLEINTFENFVAIVGGIKQREFVWDFFLKKVSNKNIDVKKFEELLKALFECSAIGNKWTIHGNDNRYEFKYKNRNAVFDINKTIVLHRAIWKSLNLA